MVEMQIEKAYRTPLAHQQVNCCSAAWSVTERDDLGFVILRGKRDDQKVLDVLATLGLILPQPSSCSTQNNGLQTLLWISPDEYLLQLPLAEKDPFIERATTACSGIHAAVVDNSGGYACLQISGNRVLEVMKKLCAYDLATTAFPPGRVLSSHLAKAPVIIYRPDPDSLQLLIRFSFADYGWRALSTAAGEYLAG